MNWNNYGNPNMPQINMPYGMNQNPYMERFNQMQQQQLVQTMPLQQPVNSLIRVTGIDGAKAYQMPPNSVVALFDDTRDVFYVKSSDAGSFSTIKAYAFMPFEEQQPTQISTTEFITREEFQKQFDELKGMIDYGKFSVSEQSATATGDARQQQRPANK